MYYGCSYTCLVRSCLRPVPRPSCRGSAFSDLYSSIYVAYNGWSANVSFTLPSPGQGKNWYRVTDTCGWAEGPNQVRAPGAEDSIGGQGTVYGLCGRGLLLLIAK